MFHKAPSSDKNYTPIYLLPDTGKRTGSVASTLKTPFFFRMKVNFRVNCERINFEYPKLFQFIQNLWH